MSFSRKTLGEFVSICTAAVVVLVIIEGPLVVGGLVAKHYAKHQKAMDPKNKAYAEDWDGIFYNHW